MLSVFHNGVAVIPDGVGPCDPQVEVVVFGAADIGLEPAHPAHNVGAEHGGSRRPDVVLAEQRHIVVGVDDRFLRGVPLNAVRTNLDTAAGYERPFGVSLEALDAGLQRQREQPIIGVEKHHERAGHVFEPLVARRALSAVPLRHVATAA